jgi:hypothetical protein
LSNDFIKLYSDVFKNLAKQAHSSKLGIVEAALEVAQDTSNILESEMMPPAAPPPGTLMNYMNMAKIPEWQRVKIELLMFRMFICCALPWALLNSEFFRAFVVALCPNFIIPDRSAFFRKHLAQEVVVWEEGFQKFLEGLSHLTLSFDGWSTRARDELYTFHTTTPRRRSFFADGHIFKGVSVTGEALLGVIVKVWLLVNFSVC